MSGTSMAYLFDDKNAEERHDTQYFEMFGNRAIYHKALYARVVHRKPWANKPITTRKDGELYNTKDDFSLTFDLADQQPKKLAERRTLEKKQLKTMYIL